MRYLRTFVNTYVALHSNAVVNDIFAYRNM